MTAAVPGAIRGRPSKARLHLLAEADALQDVRDELEAHRQEALAFADAAWPMLSRLEHVAQAVGPIAYQTVMALEAMLARYERRHLDPEPDAPAMAA